MSKIARIGIDYRMKLKKETATNYLQLDVTEEQLEVIKKALEKEPWAYANAELGKLTQSLKQLCMFQGYRLYDYFVTFI